MLSSQRCGPCCPSPWLRHPTPASRPRGAEIAYVVWCGVSYNIYIYMAVCQNLVPLVNIKIAGKWMFIPLKMVLIGIDPYPYIYILHHCVRVFVLFSIHVYIIMYTWHEHMITTGTVTVAPNSLDPRLHLSELVPRKIHGKTMAFPIRIPWKTMENHGISDFTWLPRGFQVWKWR